LAAAAQVSRGACAPDRRARPRPEDRPPPVTDLGQPPGTYRAWLDAMDPITGVFPMAGLHNTLRRLVVDGTPVATGLNAIGDSVCTTNPTLGRGLALALSGAVDLADAVGEHGADPAAQALALDRLVGAHVVPFYYDQAVIDAARLAMMRHTISGTAPGAAIRPLAVRTSRRHSRPSKVAGAEASQPRIPLVTA
jgi:2-polyprenyl-6-methoxyphenol hydroxylase-like FAD-dependent oxidoreductase